MSCQESQQEECEVLRAIYEGDERFKEVSPTTYQYKVGDESGTKTFLVEVSWPVTYPDDLPTVSLDAFYNKHIPPGVKSAVVSTLTSQAESLLGTAMTYTLFEYAKDNVDELMAAYESFSSMIQSCDVETDSKPSAASCDASGGKTKEKKEQLTKAQKRKMLGRQDEKGEMPRGWNWVDVVKHLCQTGRSDTLGDS
jgi:hypothetical protein